MATYFLAPIGNSQQFLTDTGLPLSGGLIYTYLAGTTTPTATYTTQAGTTPNSNPIVLNAAGRAPQEIWLQGGVQYKFVITTATGIALSPNTYDNLSGIGDLTFSGTSNLSEWVQLSLVTAFLSTTTFNTVGDSTSILLTGRRVKLIVTAGTLYGTVVSVTYNSGTGLSTVTVTLDSGTIDAGLSAVYYGIISPVSTSFPANTTQTFSNKTLLAAGPNTVEATSGPGGSSLGFKNRLHNGAIIINQRYGGASQTLPVNIFTPLSDRWVLAVNGAGTTMQAVTLTSAAGQQQVNALQINGAASVTNPQISQRIETANSRDLAGQAVAASFWVFQNTGSSLPVSCSISRANAQDNFSGITPDVTLTCSPSSVPSGVWTQVVAKGTLSTSAVTGLQFNIFSTGSLPAGTLFQTTLLQLEPGTAATPFEWRPFAYELAQCQRYLTICTTIETTSASAAAQQTVYWKVSLRTIPGSITNTGTSTWLPMGTDGARQSSNATVFGGATLTASAEL